MTGLPALTALMCATACYGLSSAAYIRGLFTPRWRRTGWILALGGLLLELLALALRGLTRTGVTPTVIDWLTLATAALVLLFLIWARRVEEASGGAFFLPAVLVLLLPGLFLHGLAHRTELRFADALLWLHIAAFAVAVAALLVASIGAIVQRVAEWRLRHAALGAMPPLSSLSSLVMRGLEIGLPAFALGMILGAIYARHAWGAYWSWNDKETLSFIAFCLYGCAFIALRRSRRSAFADWLLTLGALMLLLNLWVVDLVPGPHGYGA